MVQPAVRSRARHRHGAVAGDQHRELEVQVQQHVGETVEGPHQPGLDHRTVPGSAAACQVRRNPHQAAYIVKGMLPPILSIYFLCQLMALGSFSKYIPKYSTIWSFVIS